ncbi:MAG TPA: YicC/YloC family endoribonuclease [Micropepsaceae bacterium]|nr:YicC/YloC family endoribonuclease [Micropepsaceae bacterium]
MPRSVRPIPLKGSSVPLNSMTGFADSRGSHGRLRWRWEAKSVNGRGLDLRLRTPIGYEGLESGARTLAAERFKRGSLQAVLSVATEDEPGGFRVDAAALADAVKIARRVAEETGLPPARVDGLLALKGVVVQEETAALDDEARMRRDAAMLESLAGAFDLLTRARASEGAKLEAVINKQIEEVESLTGQARDLASQQPSLLRDRMMTQLKDLLAPGTNLSEDRIAQEVALLAARADLREELDRLAAHCQEARVLLGGTDPAGRKLDFLAQEFNREANTLCSKSSDIQLTHVGLALKAVIDQFREQVQNVE